MRPALPGPPGPGAGEERGEVAGGLGVDGGEPGRERQLADVGWSTPAPAQSARVR
ncbi:hypothetical protein ACIOKD_36200 [Streptomyces sp. NPDC087844]|uniref:hypothetical protein n=1 Tax=Streptomyces sp. NPDC087844 TaxID=3365805 RepID=UPI0038217EF0